MHVVFPPPPGTKTEINVTKDFLAVNALTVWTLIN